ncbi:RelA/SpoT domain-containing protein [Comamonas composti]|uniref:RelA/SpoT domain-containing protein n=1 Tax=Comamonas composti TaxID=408558 RepID=UPI00146FAC3B|nr:RelA/SpoT domain-containing protein [Comamonas composti]
MQSNFRYIAEELRRQVEDSIFSIGLLARVFARGKDHESLSEKLQRDAGKYSIGGKLIQDAIGIRVALYFPEDIPLVKSILESKYRLDLSSSAIDVPDRDQFSVTRYNLVFRLPEDLVGNFQRVAAGEALDTCFEVQLRSILSEGWHEVEHDLRYKAKESWREHDDLSRALNGVVATLETSEWSMGRIFDELAYRHYKQKNWSAMLPSLIKIRMRGQIPDELAQVLDSDTAAAKDLVRVDRSRLIKCMFAARPRIPMTMENLIYFWNAIGPQHASLTALTPALVSESASSISR